MLLNNFREKIIADINKSELSIDAIYYVMKDVMNEITSIYNRQIEAEMAAQAQQTSDSGNTESEAAAEIEKKEE